MSFELPDLPYEKNALEPAVSRQTMDYHYDKHHAAYVKKLNKAIEGTEYDAKPLDDVIFEAAEAGDDDVFNNAAQHWNHTFFWNCMNADGGGKPPGRILEGIEDAYGSFEDFRNTFLETAESHFGSGWVWLVDNEGVFEVLSTPDAENPMVESKKPLLACDLWEHAYYLDYQNDKGGFFEAFLDKLANWEFVEARLNETAWRKAA